MLMFDGKKIDPVVSLEDARRSCNEFLEVNVSSPDIMPLQPPENVMKLNVDAAVDLKHSYAAIAVIVRDHSGAMFTGITKRFHCY